MLKGHRGSFWEGDKVPGMMVVSVTRQCGRAYSPQTVRTLQKGVKW